MNDIPRKPIKITPSKVVYVYENGESGPQWSGFFITSTLTTVEWARTLIVLSILLIVSTAIGGFVYRILTLGDYRFEQIMISVFRTSPPKWVVFESSFISGLIFLLINLRKSFDKNYTSSTSGSVRFWAGTILVLWFDFIRLKLSPFRILGDFESFFTNRTTEILIAQFATALLVLVLLPLSARMVTLHLNIPSHKFSPRIYALGNWLRYLFVVGVICYFVVFITGEGAPSNLLRPLPRGALPFSISWMKLNIIGTSAMFVTMAMAAIFYRPAPSRNMRSFGLIRVIVFIFSILACGLIFQNISVINGYVDALSVAVVFAFSGIPVQRLLS